MTKYFVSSTNSILGFVWYMNKTGNYTITLYYTLQTDADIMWVVSFAGLFAAIGIGVYGWRKR